MIITPAASYQVALAPGHGYQPLHAFCVSGQDYASLLSYVLLFPSWPATLTRGNFMPVFGASQGVLQ